MRRTCLLMTQSGHRLSSRSPLSVCRIDTVTMLLSQPRGVGNETARVHHACWRRGGWRVPMTARAQQTMPLRRVYFQRLGCVLDGQHGRFCRGLAEVGFADGRNVAIDYRWADGRSKGCANSRRILYAARSRSLLLEAATAGVRDVWPRRRPFPSCSRPRSIRSRAGWLGVSIGRAET